MANLIMMIVINVAYRMGAGVGAVNDGYAGGYQHLGHPATGAEFRS